MIIRKLFKFENAHIVRGCSTQRCSQNVHGHSYKVEVLLESNYLDNGQMIYDFGLMKQSIKELLEAFDHSITLWSGDKITYIEDMKKHLFTIDSAVDAFVSQNNRMTKPLVTEYSFLKWLDEGRIVVLGGASGLGKTAYVLQMIYNLVRDNQSEDNDNNSVIGIYASSEMMIEELTMRLIVNQGVIDDTDITSVRRKFNQKVTSPEQFKENIEKAKFVLSSIPFYFLNSSRFNLKSIINMIRATREKNPNKRIFVVIDYLQLMLLDCESLQEQNRAIKDLKDALIDYKANAIVISALNRDSIKNDFVEMTAFKDSSTIEYTTDIAMLFAFKNAKSKYTLKQDEAHFNKSKISFHTKCVKNRIGNLFNNEVTFDKMQQSFNIRGFDVVYEDADGKEDKGGQNGRGRN